jgi:MFS family permease
MFAPLYGAVRADIDRQIGWAKNEVRRQTRYTAVIGSFAGVAALAALGAIVVGLIALYLWLAIQLGSFAALGVIGSGLLVLALILFLLAFSRRRPQFSERPQLQMAHPATLLGTARQGGHERIIADGAESLTDALRHGSRSEVVSMLTLIAVIGLIAGRRIR